MRKRIVSPITAALLALMAFGSNMSESYAQAGANFGPAVDSACQASNGTTPFAGQSCALCHNTGNLGQRVEPAWTWWETGNLTAFCPDAPNPPPASNQAPNGVINSPAASQTIDVGQSVSFTATGSDPDGDLPLSFTWNFGGGASNSNAQDPGAVTFTNAGTFTVTLTVTDSQGLSDPTPASRSINVNAPATGPDPAPSCTDTDGDGFAREGGSCGARDCNDTDPSVNPDASEICTDGIDNDCNGLADVVDANAVDCPVSNGCFDNDGDRFSPDGDLCGPVDCDDFDATVNPGATEACADGVDNDCDGAVDNDDPECNGSDCIGQLAGATPGTPEPPQLPAVTITRAEWDEADNELKVEGDQAPAGTPVILSNAVTGVLLATDVSERNGEWEVELEEPAAVPCRVRVEIEGRTPAERAVTDAPSDCSSGAVIVPPVDEPPVEEPPFEPPVEAPPIEEPPVEPPVGQDPPVEEPPVEPTVDISRAEWDEGDGELKVEGDQAPVGAPVTLRDADTGELLANEVVERRGDWEVELEEPTVVPCRVRVEIEGRTPAERGVTNAPPDCGSGGTQ